MMGRRLARAPGTQKDEEFFLPRLPAMVYHRTHPSSSPPALGVRTMRSLFLVLVAVGSLCSLCLSARAQPAPPATDEQVVKQANLATDGPALLEFFRKRAAGEADPGATAAVIR